MVLVSDKLNNDIGILQTKFSDREGYEARRVGLEAVPLDQHIEGGHGERQARLKIRPAPVHDLFEVHDQRQHRKHCLDEHAVLPRAARTQFEVGRIPSAAWNAVSLKTIMRPSTWRISHWKVLSATLAAAQSHPTTRPYWFNSRQSFPPTIHRWLERPFRPICCGLRPSRMGWISSIP